MQTPLIGLEACSGAHFLGRTLKQQGHDVRLITAQFVKPFVKSNKNDFVVAEAIARCRKRKNMRFVPIRTDDQLDLQAIHRVRDQNSRGFRALKVWLFIQQAGRNGYVQMISDDIRLSREVFAPIGLCPELQPLTQSLSIATFRFVPADLARNAPDVQTYLDGLNRELLTRLQDSGRAYLSNAVVNERFALRACIVNFRTSVDDIKALPSLVLRKGKKVNSQLRERCEA